MKWLIAPFIFLVFFSCGTAKKTTNASSSGSIVSNKTDNDGSSFEKAIVIEEKTESAGVAAEYAWLRKNYPGCRFNGQALTIKDKIPYDILDVVTAGGEKRKFYFNLSNFYGRF
jgi:hypothetical protein